MKIVSMMMMMMMMMIMMMRIITMTFVMCFLHPRRPQTWLALVGANKL